MTNSELTAGQRGVFDTAEAREMRGAADEQDMTMPRGLMLAVARDMHAMEAYARMSEGERAAFLDKARHTPDGEPMQRLVQDLQREYKC